MKPTNYLRVTLALAWKDLQVIFQDRFLLVVLFALPMFMTIFMSQINKRVDQMKEASQLFPVALVKLDQGTYGQQIEKTLNELAILKVVRLDSAEEAKQQVLDSQVLAAILIPAGLSERINAYEPSDIEVMIDPTQEQFASIITGIMKEVAAPVVIRGEVSYAIRTLLSEYPLYQQADERTRQVFEAQSVAVQMSQVQKMWMEPWVSVEAKTQTGEAVVKIPNNMYVLNAPSFTVFFAFFIVGTMSAELLKERKEGALRRLMAAPIHPWMIIAAKMLAYLMLVIIQVGLLFGVANLAFDMPLGESLLGLALVSVAMGLAATSIGMLVASISKTAKQADTTGTLMGFVLGIVGGSIPFGISTPLYKGGGIVETIAKFTPQAHALMGFDALLNEGGGMAQALPQVLILLGFAALAFTIASMRFKFE